MEMEIEFQCPWHPSEEVVGICASCLRERLYCLKASKNKLRTHNIVYTSDSDSDSFLEFDELRVRNFLPREKREIVARKNFMWFTKSKSQKKEKRAFFSVRSIFQRLRRSKEESKEDTCCISHEDSFISIKLDKSGSSARSSSAGEVKGILSTCRTRMNYQQDGASTSASNPVRWRTRMNALFHINSKPSNKGNHNNNQYPTLSSLYSDRHPHPHPHRHRHCITSTTGSKKSWMRSLTSPKWRLH